MARPPLPVGTWGNIRTEKLGPNRYCARARFRDYDGKTRDVEATGTTGPAAVRALKEKLRDRTAPNDDEITRETHISLLANLWIEEITAEERVTPQTINRYESVVRTAVMPALGNLRIREASVGRPDVCLCGTPGSADDQPGTRHGSATYSASHGSRARHWTTGGRSHSNPQVAAAHAGQVGT